MNLQQTPAIGFCRQCLQNPDTQVIQMSVVKWLAGGLSTELPHRTCSQPLEDLKPHDWHGPCLHPDSES